jgi:hypothetical protein
MAMRFARQPKLLLKGYVPQYLGTTEYTVLPVQGKAQFSEQVAALMCISGLKSTYHR